MNRVREEEVMILNRKSGTTVTVRAKACALSASPEVKINKDKIPIVIKNMQFTLKKY